MSLRDRNDGCYGEKKLAMVLSTRNKLHILVFVDLISRNESTARDRIGNPDSTAKFLDVPSLLWVLGIHSYQFNPP